MAGNEPEKREVPSDGGKIRRMCKHGFNHCGICHAKDGSEWPWNHTPVATKGLDDKDEAARINGAIRGKTVSCINYNEAGDSDIAIYFTDGSRVVLSTLGGVEIKEI